MWDIGKPVCIFSPLASSLVKGEHFQFWSASLSEQGLVMNIISYTAHIWSRKIVSKHSHSHTTLSFRSSELHPLLHPGTDRVRHLAASAVWRVCGKLRTWLMALSPGDTKDASPAADNNTRGERGEQFNTTCTYFSAPSHACFSTNIYSQGLTYDCSRQLWHWQKRQSWRQRAWHT